MPPYNASDPNASFLSSSCLDFLLIELVPLAYRVSHESDASASLEAADTTTTPTTSSTAAAAVTESPSSTRRRRSSTGAGAGLGGRKMEEDEELDAVHFRLESLGYRVGQGLVERYVFFLPVIVSLKGTEKKTKENRTS